MKGLSVLALLKDLCMNHQTDEINGNKQQKDGLTLQKQTCQPMIKENWETHEKKKKLEIVCEILFFADQDLGRGGISIY